MKARLMRTSALTGLMMMRWRWLVPALGDLDGHHPPQLNVEGLST
jgi:hypothetical protein